jgi:hypothetical protein
MVLNGKRLKSTIFERLPELLSWVGVKTKDIVKLDPRASQSPAFASSSIPKACQAFRFLKKAVTPSVTALARSQQALDKTVITALSGRKSAI